MTVGPDSVGLNDFFRAHSACRLQRSLWREQIVDAFCDYVDEDSFADWHLALCKFATLKPLMFTRRAAVECALSVFRQNPAATLAGLSLLRNQVTHAVSSLLRPGVSWTREDRLSLDRPEHLAQFESIWHPEYQRYCEHILNHLIRVPLYVIGTIKQKDYLSPPLASRVAALQASGLTELATGYDSVVRNAISHGTTTFGAGEVRYVDHSDARLVSPWEFSNLFDDLVDTCHSIVVALVLFLWNHQPLADSEGLSKLPLGLRFMLIDAFSSHPGLQLLSAVESDVGGPGRQLNLVCRVRTKSRSAQMFEGVHTCWNASRFGGCDYKTISISLDCGMSVLATMLLDGERLSRASAQNEALDRCVGEILQATLLWYDASDLDRRLFVWKSILPLQFEAAKRQIVRDWRRRGLKVIGCRYAILKTIGGDSGNLRLLEAHVVLRDKGPVAEEMLCAIVRHAVRRLRKQWIHGADLEGQKARRGWPHYIRVRLYAEEKRVRTLMSYGWKDKGLLLIAEWTSPRKSIEPLYTAQADAILGRIRIKYNRAPGVRRGAQ